MNEIGFVLFAGAALALLFAFHRAESQRAAAMLQKIEAGCGGFRYWAGVHPHDGERFGLVGVVQAKTQIRGYAEMVVKPRRRASSSCRANNRE